MVSATLLVLMVTMQSCQKADIVSTTPLNCPFEGNPVYRENPKSVEFQSLIENYVHQGLPGIILLVKDDNGFYIGSAGMADIKEKTALQACHISKICSITKLELGVAIFRLQEKGILSLDDPIRNYISGDILDKIKNCEHSLTIRNLMNHTSGIYDVIEDEGFYLQVLNDPGKQWIRKYTLALAKEMLGIVRSKYGSIPIPNAEVNLDGDTLRTEASVEKETLITQLREELEALSRRNMLERQKEESEFQQDIISRSPLNIYLG